MDYATACLLKMLRMVTLSGILVLASMATDLLSTSATNCTRSAAVGGGGGGGREGVGGEEEEAEAEAEARGWWRWEAARDDATMASVRRGWRSKRGTGGRR